LKTSFPQHRRFFSGGRTAEGFFTVKANLDQAIDRGLSYAPYCDLIWCETSTPDLSEAKEFADAIHEKFPGKYLAYNCSPSFNWKKKLNDNEMLNFREKLSEMGYKYQFITLAGWHALNLSMFKLSQGYIKEGMLAYSKFQQKEFEAEVDGYRAVKHQSFVGVGYYDLVQKVITQGNSSIGALEQSTEAAQF
jgi:isocitrate lyase